MKNIDQIDFTESYIDSRDIIARQEDLQDDLDSLKEALKDAKENLSSYLKTNSPEEDGDSLDELKLAVEDAMDDLVRFDNDQGVELELLNKVIEQGEDSPDWVYGETLIKEDYFTDYIKNLVEECFELPKEFDSGEWPWRHMTMDWEAAAEEAKQDYTEIDCGGETYYIRS